MTSDDTCECGHAWTEHAKMRNGSSACRHFGCGCRDVVAPPPRPMTFGQYFVARIIRAYEIKDEEK